MKLEFLSSALEDLEWVSQYYGRVFPQGRNNFRSSFRATKKLLKQNPYIGMSLDYNKNARRLIIVKTPFALIYRVTKTHIEVIRILDNRSDNAKMRLE